MRYAVYFTPPPQAPLAEAAARWLGRDAFSGAELPPGDVPGIAPENWRVATMEPRRYGFHATLKAPFRLAEGRQEEQLIAALESFAAERRPFAGPRLAIEAIDGFLALVPAEGSPDLENLAAEAVKTFEPFRAALTEAEIARRRPERLSPPERENLTRWGYPHVFDQFRFHMTLTGSLDAGDLPRFRQALGPRFAPLLDLPLAVDAVALFAEPGPGAPFTVRALARFERSASAA